MSFGTFPLDSVGLSQAQLSSCTRADLHTAQDLFLSSPQDLIKKLQLRSSTTVQPQQIVSNLLIQVSKAILPSVQRSSLRSVEGDKERWVRFGDEGIDGALGGGVRRGVLTEIVGESAAGKSHLALTLALTAQLPSLTADPGGAIILTTERGIPVDRLHELAESIIRRNDDPLRPVTVRRLLDDIHTTKMNEIDHLINCLTYVVPRLLESRNGSSRDTNQKKEPPIRIIILDSITSLLRGDSTNPTNTISLTERSRYICTIADQLKSLAEKYDLAALVVNQVSDVFPKLRSAPQPTSPSANEGNPPSSSAIISQFYSDGAEPPMLYSTQSRWFSGQSGSLKKEASLGIVWANAVNTRIMVSRTGRRRMMSERDLLVARKRARLGSPDPGGVEDDHTELEGVSDSASPTLIRRFHIIFSPFSPPSTTDYVITSSGVHSIPDTTKIQDATTEVRSRARRAKAILELDRVENGDDSLELGDGDSEEVPLGIGAEAVVDEVEVELGGGDEFGEVFDDLGDLPAEFWDGALGGDGQGDVLKDV